MEICKYCWLGVGCDVGVILLLEYVWIDVIFVIIIGWFRCFEVLINELFKGYLRKGYKF